MPTTQLQCPVCQHTSERNIPLYINTQLHPHFVQALLTNQLYLFECPSCGAKRQIEVQMVYHDPIDQTLILVLPGIGRDFGKPETYLKRILPDATLNLDDYRLRIVPNMASLIEKIQIFDAELNDKVVEIVKLLSDGLLAQEHPEHQIQSRFFYTQNGEPKLLYITDKGQFIADFNESLVNFADDKYKKLHNPEALGEFQIIDGNWAIHLLDNK